VNYPFVYINDTATYYGNAMPATLVALIMQYNTADQGGSFSSEIIIYQIVDTIIRVVLNRKYKL